MEKLHAPLRIALGLLLAGSLLTACNATVPAKNTPEKTLQETADTALMSSRKLTTAEVDAIMVSYSMCRAKDYR